MNNYSSIYTQAYGLLKKGDPASVSEGLALLRQLTIDNPTDANVWFEYAGAFDFLGREVEALPFYQRTFGMFEDLAAEDQPRLYLQMGSTLRNLKKYSESQKLLSEGVEKFPKVAALKSFLGLTEYSSGNFRTAAKLFLESSLADPDDTSINDYSRALREYFDQLDIFPPRQRNWMRIHLHDCQDANGNSAPVRIEHAEALARLMSVSYQGTVDSEGESLEQCLFETKNTMDGKYGTFLSDASFVSFDGPKATCASMITLWKGHPLLALSMTDPNYQGRGLANTLIRRSMWALKSFGYKVLFLVVTEGNTPAERLYLKLGFEFLGPSIPGRTARFLGGEK